MNPERFGRMKEILLTALALPKEERAAYLDRACGEDAELRREVTELLGQKDRTAGIVKTGALENALGEAASPGPRPRMPGQVGPYRILGILGEGGMGIVYRAEQQVPVHREVALKLVRTGIDSAGAVARFESERQVLAIMDHPNIARLFDAGSEDNGRPYFVMELVRGVPITEYCRANRLEVRERVRLHLEVCRAVRHAHRRGVIHRDLKPSNVLVTMAGGQSVPKVIDFSIAKALGEPALGTEFRTRTGQVVGTLEYMSPEQAAGRVDAVDTRSDVYALGVVLYEMIAERLPYDVAGQPLPEAVRRIAEEPPSPLRGAKTTATGRVDADLHTIVNKCLEKDPDRRYGSAAELVEDLERHLDSRPILARPPSTIYQLRKLVGRHRVAFGAAALVFAFLAVFSVTLAVQLGIQRRERARAEAQARKAERVTEFLKEAFKAAREDRGYDATVKETLDAAAEKLAKGERDPEADVAIRQAIGDAYMNFGEYDKAEWLLREALEMQERRLGPAHPEVGTAHRSLAVNFLGAEKTEEAEREARRALEIHEGQRAPDPRLVALDLGVLGAIRLLKYDLDDAEPLIRRQIALYENEIRRSDQTIQELATAKETLAEVLQNGGRVGEAEVIVREVLELRRRTGGTDRTTGVAMSLDNLAYILTRQGKSVDAEPIFREALEIRRKIRGPGHPETAISLRNLGLCLRSLRRFAEAEGALREAAAIQLEALGRETPGYGSVLVELGVLHAAQDHVPEAERFTREALEIQRKVYGEEHTVVAGGLRSLGRILEAGGRYDEAEAAFRSGLAMLEEILAPDDVQISYGLASVAVFLALRGRFEEAAPLQERAVAIVERKQDKDAPERIATLGWRAFILDGLGRFAEAEALRDDCLTRTRRIFGDEHPWIASGLHARAMALRRQRRFDEALPVAREAVAMRRKLLGGDHKDLAASLLELAEILALRGDLGEARPAAREALAIWKKAPFVDPPLLARAREIAGEGENGER